MFLGRPAGRFFALSRQDRNRSLCGVDESVIVFRRTDLLLFSVPTYSFLGNEVVFDHEATLAELCKKMLTFDNIKSRVKEMKPWGNEETLVISYSWTDTEGNNEEDFIVLIYRNS